MTARRPPVVLRCTLPAESVETLIALQRPWETDSQVVRRLIRVEARRIEEERAIEKWRGVLLKARDGGFWARQQLKYHGVTGRWPEDCNA